MYIGTMKSGKTSLPTAAPAPDLERIDEAVLALLWLTAWTEHAGTEFAVSAAWKGHDWESLGRLHEKGLIGDPVGKQKSIVFTEEGRERALWEEFRPKMLGKDDEGWFTTDDAKKRPKDLGYFMGYRIAQAFYERATDKKAAIRDILRMSDAEEFLERSGYAEKWR